MKNQPKAKKKKEVHFLCILNVCSKQSDGLGSFSGNLVDRFLSVVTPFLRACTLNHPQS